MSAKNPKTEICKGEYPLLKQVKNEEQDDQFIDVVCGKKVCSIRSKQLTDEEKAAIDTKQKEDHEARKQKKAKKQKRKHKQKEPSATPKPKRKSKKRDEVGVSVVDTQ